MSARDEESKSARGEEKREVPPRPAPARAKPANDAVLRALSEVEQTLARLKQARAERAEAEARYKAELAERDAREKQLASERDEALRRADSLGREHEAAEAERRRLADELEQLRADLDKAGSDRAELSHARSREQEFHAAIQELHARAEELAAQLSVASAEADRCRAETEALQGRAAQLEAEREHAQRRVQECEAELAARDARLRETEAERDRVGAEIEQARQGLAERLQELEESNRDAAILSAKVTELETRVWELSTALEETRRDAAALQSGEASAASRIAELSALLEETRSESERLRAECHAALQVAENTRRAAEADAIAHEQRLAEAQARAAAELEQANHRIEQLCAGADADASLREDLEGLRAKLEAAAAERDTLRAAAEEAIATADARHKDAESLHAKLDLAAEQLEAMREALAERDALLAAGGADAEEVVRLRHELEQARQKLAAAKSTGGRKRGGQASVEMQERISLRRERLKRVRRALSEREQQFEKASSILADRVKMCDELLGRRRELAEAREIVERTHRKIVSGRARSSAAAVVFFASSLLVVLAGASWAVVTNFFPASYAATAVLAADFRGLTPELDEPKAWQAFHEQLLLDPQVLGRVAERMSQRGFEELSAAAVVKAKLDQDLSWSSPEPGKLVLELRGQGKDATARMLDVYATTIEVEANALRPNRSDSAETIISERARAASEPIHDERPMRAAIGLAGAAAVATLLWAGIWRRMVQTKHAFENATQIDHLLEEARWADPIQQIIDSRNQAEPDSRAA